MNDSWRKEAPTEPGYYWCYPEHGDEPYIVEVCEKFVAKAGEFEVYAFGIERPVELSAYNKPLWAGPLHPPAK